MVSTCERIVRVGRAVDRTVSFLGRIGAFCKRRKKLVAIIAVNVLLLTGLLSWLLPDWMPRPVLSIETPSEKQAKQAEPLHDVQAKPNSARGRWKATKNGDASKNPAPLACGLPSWT